MDWYFRDRALGFSGLHDAGSSIGVAEQGATVFGDLAGGAEGGAAQGVGGALAVEAQSVAAITVRGAGRPERCARTNAQQVAVGIGYAEAAAALVSEVARLAVRQAGVVRLWTEAASDAGDGLIA